MVSERLDQRLNAFFSRLDELRARRAARGVTPSSPPTPLSGDLAPATPAQAQESNRVEIGGFPGSGIIENVLSTKGVQSSLGNIQKLTEATGGALTLGASRVLPGKQAIERTFGEVLDERGVGFARNPFDIAGQAQDLAEAFRRQDLPSGTVSLPFEIGLPNNKSLQDIDVGVKGAIELVADPTNLIPGKVIASAGLAPVKAVTAGTKRAALAVPSETFQAGVRSASEAPGTLRQFLRGGDIAPTAAPQGVLIRGSETIELAERGVKQAPEQIARVEQTAALNDSFNAFQESVPEIVKKLRESTNFALGPLRWAGDKIHPMAFSKPGDKITKAMLFHFRRQAAAPTQVADSTARLFTTKTLLGNTKRGFNIGGDDASAIFNIDDNGFITNLAGRSTDDINTTHYLTVLEKGFGSDGAFSEKFRVGQVTTPQLDDTGNVIGVTAKATEKTVLEMTDDELVRAINDGLIAPDFAEQAFYVKQVQDFFKEIDSMFVESGVEFSRVKLAEGESYISRIVESINLVDQRGPSRRVGATQSLEKGRILLEDRLLEGMKNGVRYQPNPEAAISEALESAYHVVRDTLLEKELGAHALVRRKEFLSQAERIAKHTQREVKRAEGALTRLKFAARGASLTGAQTRSIRALGENVETKFNSAMALKGQRQRAALKEVRTLAKTELDQAREVSRMIKSVVTDAGRKAEGRPTKLNEVFQNLGLQPGVITREFAERYPETADNLRRLWRAAAVQQPRRGQVSEGLPSRPTGRSGAQASPVTPGTPGRARQVRQTSTGASADALSVAQAAKRALVKSINRDIDAIVDVANRVDTITKVGNRTAGNLIGGERRFLAKYSPELLERVDAASALDDVKGKSLALKDLTKEVEEILGIKREFAEVAQGVLTGRRRQLENMRVSVRGKGVDPVTGRRIFERDADELKLLFKGEGPPVNEFTPEGQTSLILRESSEIPSLKGLYFTEAEVKHIERVLPPGARRGQGALKDRLDSFFLQTVPGFADTLRVLKAGFDFGAPFLQGIPVLARRPDIWRKATVRHFKAFGSPEGHAAYLNTKMDVVREMTDHGVPLSGAATDYFLAIQSGGSLRNIGERIDNAIIDRGISPENTAVQGLRATGRVGLKAALKFEHSFEAFGDYARIELWSALREQAQRSGPEGLSELASTVRNMTGALDAGRIGISPSQQAFERGWLFFSPRYTRASLALVANSFQGGFRGQQARQTMVNMVSAGAAMYYGIATALGQEPKLDPRPKSMGGDGAEFMTIDAAGQNVGIGSFWTSFVRLIGNTVGAAADDPETLFRPSVRDNPIVRWVRSRSAPATGLAVDFANGANFLGEPLDTPFSQDGAVDWTLHLGRQTLPFAVENAIFEEGPLGSRFAGAFVEMGGTRTFPISKLEQRNSEREVSAQERFGKPWEELNGLQKRTLENDPLRSLGSLTQEVREQQTRFNPTDPDSLDFKMQQFFGRREEAEESWREQVTDALALFENGQIDTVTFKEVWLEPANRERQILIEDLNESEEFEDVLEFFRKQQERGAPIPPEDLAYVEYIEEVIVPDFRREIGTFDFDAQEAAELRYRDKWGDEMLTFIRERFNANRSSQDFQFPSLIEELYDGRLRFQAYWRDVDDAVIAQQRDPESLRALYGDWKESTPTARTLMRENNRALDRFLSQVERVRRRLREDNAELDAFLYRWGFTNTLAHRDNDFVDAETHWRYAPAMAFPLPVHSSVQ